MKKPKEAVEALITMLNVLLALGVLCGVIVGIIVMAKTDTATGLGIFFGSIIGGILSAVIVIRLHTAFNSIIEVLPSEKSISIKDRPIPTQSPKCETEIMLALADKSDNEQVKYLQDRLSILKDKIDRESDIEKRVDYRVEAKFIETLLQQSDSK